MKKVSLLLSSAAAALTPVVAFAATPSVQQLLIDSMQFVHRIVLPLLFSLAFLFFIVNLVRYFIIQGTDEKGREQAKRLAIWGIIAFVLMVSIWGIVNLLVAGLGFNTQSSPCPDYVPPSECAGAITPSPIIPSTVPFPTTPT